MRFTRRAATTASYAAIVGDRWLWVALDSPGAPATLVVDGAEVPVEAHPDEQAFRVDLSALPGPGRWPVRAGGRAVLDPGTRASGPGTTHALEADDARHLHVVRRPPAGGARVRALRLRTGSVEIDLEGLDDLPAGAAALVLLGPGGPVASVPVTAGTVVLAPADLAGVDPGDLRAEVAGLPVRRRAHDLVDPGAAVLLPAVHPVGEVDALARLRWARDATLQVRVLR